MTTNTNTNFNERIVSTRHEVAATSEIGCDLVFFQCIESPKYHGIKWAVRDQCGQVLSVSGGWEYERPTSSRDDKFYERCRFDSLEAALAAYDMQSAKPAKESA